MSVRHAADVAEIGSFVEASGTAPVGALGNASYCGRPCCPSAQKGRPKAHREGVQPTLWCAAKGESKRGVPCCSGGQARCCTAEAARAARSGSMAVLTVVGW